MTKSFICDRDLLKYGYVGFDIDGTIYDEFSFISQAYSDVSYLLGREYDLNPRSVYELMLNIWKEKGSSYPIFQEIMQKNFGIMLDAVMIGKCVEAFRSADFTIEPFPEIISVLNFLSDNGKPLFIVSDGNKDLQLKKFNALGLDRWFKTDNVYISGMFGKDFQKPSIKVLQFLKPYIGESPKVLFIGDRAVDEQFAVNAGFDFINVRDILKNE